MFKLFLALLAFPMLMCGTVSEKTEVQNTNEPQIMMVKRAANPETGEWEDEVYHYTDSEGSIIVTLKSAEKYEAVLTQGETVATVSGKYTLVEDKLTLFLGEDTFLEFKVLEDGKLERFEVVVEPEEEEEDNPYAHMTLNELIEALKTELKKDQIDVNTVGKILLALLGVFATSIIGLLVAIIRMKVKGAKREEIIEMVEKKAADDMAQYQDQVKELINDLLVKVEKKIDDTEEQRKAEAEAQNLKLKESIAKAKKNLAINDVLDN